MMDIGDIIGRIIGKNIDSESESLQVQVEVNGDEDIRTVQVFRPAGLDTSPLDDTRAVIIDIGKSWQIAVAFDDASTSEVEAGDIELYALDDNGNRQGKVRCKKDGTVIINNGDDYAVAFNRLKKAFDDLKADLNSFINKYNIHMHPGVTAGSSSTATIATPEQPSTANMDNAKSDTIKVP